VSPSRQLQNTENGVNIQRNSSGDVKIVEMSSVVAEDIQAHITSFEKRTVAKEDDPRLAKLENFLRNGLEKLTLDRKVTPKFFEVTVDPAFRYVISYSQLLGNGPQATRAAGSKAQSDTVKDTKARGDGDERLEIAAIGKKSFDLLDQGYFDTLYKFLWSFIDIAFLDEKNNISPDLKFLEQGCPGAGIKLRDTTRNIFENLLMTWERFRDAKYVTATYKSIRDDLHHNILRNVNEIKPFLLRFVAFRMWCESKALNILVRREDVLGKPQLQFEEASSVPAYLLQYVAYEYRCHEDKRVRSLALTYLHANRCIWKYLLQKNLAKNCCLKIIELKKYDDALLQQRKTENKGQSRRKKLPETLVDILGFKIVKSQDTTPSKAAAIPSKGDSSTAIDWVTDLSSEEEDLIKAYIAANEEMINKSPISFFRYLIFEFILVQTETIEMVYAVLDQTPGKYNTPSPHMERQERLFTADDKHRVLPEWILRDIEKHLAEPSNALDRVGLEKLKQRLVKIVNEANSSGDQCGKLVCLVKSDVAIRGICREYEELGEKRQEKRPAQKHTAKNDHAKHVPEGADDIIDDSDDDNEGDDDNHDRLNNNNLVVTSTFPSIMPVPGDPKFRSFWNSHIDWVIKIRQEAKVAISQHIKTTREYPNNTLKSVKTMNAARDGIYFMAGSRSMARQVITMLDVVCKTQAHETSLVEFHGVKVPTRLTKRTIREVLRVTLVKYMGSTMLKISPYLMQKIDSHYKEHMHGLKITLEQYIRCGYLLALSMQYSRIELNRASANNHRSLNDLREEDRYVIKIYVSLYFAIYTFPYGELVTWGAQANGGVTDADIANLLASELPKHADL